MKARSIDYTIFEAAAEIVNPGTEVTIRDDFSWGFDGAMCIGVSGPPAAVLTFVFGLGRLTHPGCTAVTDDLITDIAYRTEGLGMTALFPGWQFEAEGDR